MQFYMYLTTYFIVGFCTLQVCHAAVIGFSSNLPYLSCAGSDLTMFLFDTV